MDKKPIAVYCIADKNNLGYARSLINSFHKFHDWPFILITDETDQAKLPKDVIIEDLKPYLEDPAFFYRATPIIGEKLLDEYECVLKIDADCLVLGDLSYIENTKDYDVATVINWNRYDPNFYGLVEIMRLGISPIDYFNCGLVALRSKKFCHTWKVNCFTPQFDRSQYREQDILNAICYFGNWNVRCLDHGDGVAKVNAWWGMIAKGELHRAELRGEEIVVPKGDGDPPFPPQDTVLKCVHLGGGAGAKKDNWGAFFSPEVMERINYLKGDNGTTESKKA